MRARDLMTKDVITLFPHQTVEEAAALMFQHEITGIPVINENREVIGMVTEEDVIRTALPPMYESIPSLAFLGDVNDFGENLSRLRKIPVERVMHRNMIFCQTDTPIVEVARLMVLHNSRRVPVLDGKQLVGIISRTDILREMYREFPDIDNDNVGNTSCP